MKDNRKEIEEAFNTYMKEANAFWDGTGKSANAISKAGSNARAALMDIKNLAAAERTAIQEKKNGK